MVNSLFLIILTRYHNFTRNRNHQLSKSENVNEFSFAKYEKNVTVSLSIYILAAIPIGSDAEPSAIFKVRVKIQK